MVDSHNYRMMKRAVELAGKTSLTPFLFPKKMSQVKVKKEVVELANNTLNYEQKKCVEDIVNNISSPVPVSIYNISCHGFTIVKT